eukprot:CAMPEP_0183350334 /NCGR_PEP_ID=MMETSP0164_2-20130417/18438_1 /TAXON_ID=221442 /ORGANISM="Coccolithus pelagicus ssp braarudi, Strain PLY182g" /LENGTH=88 /DNA_ID=CAMNT_0025522233 /DNA_START=132 /DNA_END=398 /DNA_ORIENTATION=-
MRGARGAAVRERKSAPVSTCRLDALARSVTQSNEVPRGPRRRRPIRAKEGSRGQWGITATPRLNASGRACGMWLVPLSWPGKWPRHGV